MSFNEEWGLLRADATERTARGTAPGATGAAAPEPGPDADAVQEAREAVLERLADFRSTAVLVPLDAEGGLWTAPLGGLDWICAFTDEAALARFAEARGETEREWPYRTVLGSRLFDEVVPALAFPCGVALNAAGPDGATFPPVRGIVPDSAALDAAPHGGTGPAGAYGRGAV